MFRRSRLLFVFGDPADAAKLFLDQVMESTTGPAVPDKHFEDLSEKDLRIAMTWLHAAITHAFRHGVEESVVAVLIEWYDEVFAALAEASERFRERFMAGFVQPPTGKEYRKRYLGIVKAASES